jgi:hypothetical protein
MFYLTHIPRHKIKINIFSEPLSDKKPSDILNVKEELDEIKKQKQKLVRKTYLNLFDED